jgi:hypothetical protein
MNEFDRDGQNYNMSVSGGLDIGEKWNFIGSYKGTHIDAVYRDPDKLSSDWFQRWERFTTNDPNGPERRCPSKTA